MCTYLVRICWRHYTGCFAQGFVFQVISEKTICRQDFTRNLREIFIWKLLLNVIPTNLVRNSLLSLFCHFIETKNNQIFSKLVVWWQEIVFFFCLQQVVLYLKRMLNSIDFHKRIFVHVIPACIIVPWFNLWFSSAV